MVVNAVAFHPDGSTLATDSDDSTARLSITAPDKLADLVCQQVQRNLRLEEWEQFVGPAIPSQSSCPNLLRGEGAPGAVTLGHLPIATATKTEGP